MTELTPEPSDFTDEDMEPTVVDPSDINADEIVVDDDDTD